jgi:hypothetical protein
MCVPRIHFIYKINDGRQFFPSMYNCNTLARYDNCLTRTANNDAVKCFCVVSCLWIVGW